MPLQDTKPISLGDIYAEFGAVGNSPPLGEFVRGGMFVEDTPSNQGVPTSKPISLGDFLGAVNATIKTIVAGDINSVAGIVGWDLGDGSISPDRILIPGVLLTSISSGDQPVPQGQFITGVDSQVAEDTISLVLIERLDIVQTHTYIVGQGSGYEFISQSGLSIWAWDRELAFEIGRSYDCTFEL